MRARRNPWRGTEGFWLLPDGQARQVVDHFEDLRTEPLYAEYGVKQSWKPDDREKALRYAMRKGLIRVRGHRNYTVIEFDRMSDHVAELIVGFVRRFAFHEDDDFHLHELATGRSWEGSYGRMVKFSDVFERLLR